MVAAHRTSKRQNGFCLHWGTKYALNALIRTIERGMYFDMGINLEDLPLRAQMRIRKQLGEQIPNGAAGTTGGEKKKSKYNAHKTWVDGVCFDSKKEAEYYEYLKVMQKAGQIDGFMYHGKIVCVYGNKSDRRAVTYETDFVILKPDGTYEIVDTKGFVTETFKLKMKALSEKYPKVKIELN